MSTTKPQIDCIFVTGVNRSGLSVLGACLKKLGVETGFGEREDNVRDSISRMHEKFFRDLDDTGSRFGKRPEWWKETQQAREANAKINQAIDVLLDKKRLVSIVDSRLCRLIPLWTHLLDKRNLKAGIVLCVRHPWETALSMRKESGLDLRHGHQRWLTTTLSAIDDCRESSFAIVVYDRLLADPVSTLRQVEVQLGLSFPKSLKEHSDSIRCVIQPERKHYHISRMPINDPGWKSFDQFFWFYDLLYNVALVEEGRRENLVEIAKAVAWVRSENMAETGQVRRLSQRLQSKMASVAMSGVPPAMVRSGFSATPQIHEPKDNPVVLSSARKTCNRRIELVERKRRETSHYEKRALDVYRSRIDSLEKADHNGKNRRNRPALFEFGRIPLVVYNRIIRSLGVLKNKRKIDILDSYFNSHWYQSIYPHAFGPRLDPRLHYLQLGFKQGCNPNPLFLNDWYLETNPGVMASGTNPLVHYLKYGKDEGRKPNPLFENGWYANRHLGEDVRETDPLVHYLKYGVRDCINPNALFDTSWYLQSYPDVAAAGINPLAHYLDKGVAEGRNPNALFDTSWYLQSYPDVAAAGINPLAHYLDKGAAEGRNPNALFDTSWYLQSYPDVTAAGINPLAHYLETGAEEGRNPNALFHTNWYQTHYPDAAKSGANPLAHFLDCAFEKGCCPNPLFDTEWYLDRYPDALRSGVNPLAHYLAAGGKKGYLPHPLFDARWYLQKYPDVAQSDENPLVHFFSFGQSDSRDPNPLFDTAWYRRTCKESGKSETNPLVHYIEVGSAAGYTPHPLFDSVWYSNRYPDVIPSGMDPLVHYLYAGAKQGRHPHPLFDATWYLNMYPDVAASGTNPLIHFLEFGAKEGRDPNPLFDTKWYVKTYGDVAESGINPLIHYLTVGVGEGRDPNALFDTDWYLKRYTEVAAAGQNPLAHYLTDGLAQGCNPNPLFNTAWYLKEYEDVADSGVNPLAHYLRVGEKEGRNPNALFDSRWYAKTYPDVAKSETSLLAHFIRFGVEDGRNPNSLFHTTWYLQQNDDVTSSGINPLAHYLEVGEKEGRDPNPLFDTDWYRGTYGDVVETGVSPLAHFLDFCVADGRDPNPLFDTKWYLRTYPGVTSSGLNPLAHYLRFGHRGDHNPSPFFNGKWYMETYMGGEEKGENPLVHYMQIGLDAGHDVAPAIEAQFKGTVGERIFSGGPEGPHQNEKLQSLNVLIILYGSASSNSGYQAYHHAERLMDQGINCIIAVPDKEKDFKDLGGEITCQILSFGDIETVGLCFNNGRGPDIVHAWTPRERVRKFCRRLEKRYCFQTIVHLEDNEEYLTEAAVGEAWSTLQSLSVDQLDRLVPADAYHPIHGRRWIENADGITMVIGALEAFNYADIPSLTIMPVVDERLFYPRPINRALRHRLEIPEDHRVLVYTGNVHGANQDEVASLYRAVEILNEEKIPTTLIRTGRSDKSWPWANATADGFFRDLGWVDREKLPEIMAAADYFVQPGNPGDFNDFRIPCKLPEYFAMGKPVILPRSNIGLLIDHGRNGYILEKGDAKDIAQAVIVLHGDKALTQQLGAGSVSFYLDHFASPWMNLRLDDFYRNVHAEINKDAIPSATSLQASFPSGEAEHTWCLWSSLAGDPTTGTRSPQLTMKIESMGSGTIDVVPCVESALRERKLPMEKPWVGFVHAPPAHLPEWLAHKPPYGQFCNGASFFSDHWKRSRTMCRGLFVQSTSHARRLKPFTGLPVHVIRFPLPHVREKWSFDSYASDDKKQIVQVGWWMQRAHGIHLLPVQKMKKVWIQGCSSYLDAIMAAEKKHLITNRILYDFMLDSISACPEPDAAECRSILSHAIVFSHYHDDSCLDLLLVCIASQTPILINPYGAIREVLGEKYPLYYYSYTDAAKKAMDLHRVKDANVYLQQMAEKHVIETRKMARKIDQHLQGMAN